MGSIADDIPDWHFDAIVDVSIAWDINGTEAENFLVEVGLFD